LQLLQFFCDLGKFLQLLQFFCDFGKFLQLLKFFMSFKFRRDSDSRFGTATTGAEEEGGK
jgi:hypothetical protein